jgi:zinc-binding alcohol dehydrogenase family protein
MNSNTEYKTILAGDLFYEGKGQLHGPIDREILVQVKATSINPLDYKVRARREGAVIGWDGAGIIVAVGEKVENFQVGDAVYYSGDLNKPGSYAEYQIVDERIVGHMPKNLNFGEAAALPLTSITAYECLFDRLQINKEDESKSILIVGGAGGVGSMAIQLIKSMTNHKVIATASRPESVEWCKKLGADFVVNHHADLSSELSTTDFNEVDFALVTNNSEQLREVLPEIIKPQGKLCLIDDPAQFDIVPFKVKSISIHWELMFTRSLFKTSDLINQHYLLDRVSELIEKGLIKSTLNKLLYGLDPQNFEALHKLIKSGNSIGKAVVVF